MFFFPYRVDLQLRYVPWLTFTVCLLCAIVFLAQQGNQRKLEAATNNWCQQEAPRQDFYTAVVARFQDAPDNCFNLMLSLHLSDDTEAHIAELVEGMEPLPGLSTLASEQYATEFLRSRYRDYDQAAPDYLTGRLWHERGTFNPLRMVTASFAHGSWSHLLGNLFFFFAFAAAVEGMAGRAAFIGLILGGSLWIGIVNSIGVQAGMAANSIGLSGIVMAMMALFVFFLPYGRIRCLLWFLFIVRILAVPAWILAAWYIGWDVYSYLFLPRAGVDLGAHLSGAVFGYVAGWVFFQQRRRRVRAMLGAWR